MNLFGPDAFLPSNSNPNALPRTTVIGVWAVVVAMGLNPVIALVFARRRLGQLNAAAWLLLYGTIVIIGEHPFFTIAYTMLTPPNGGSKILDPAALGPLFPHARYHFLMSGIYSIVALVLIAIIGFKWLREGRRAAWYAITLALVLGGGSELTFGLIMYPHGAAISICNQGACDYSIPIGVYLYTYIVAWITALVISYKPIFFEQRMEKYQSTGYANQKILNSI